MKLKNYLTKISYKFKNKSKELLYITILLWMQTLVPSILINTPIATPNGLISIENINIGDSLISYSSQKSLTKVIVTHISSTFIDTIIIITTNQGKIYSCPNQLFYNPIAKKWIKAKNINKTTVLLNANLDYCMCHHIDIISISPIKIYNISTTSPHSFFAHEQALLTHNAIPLIISLAWLFGQGIEFLGATVGTAIFGTIFGINLYKKNNKVDANFSITPQTGESCGGYNPDPDDDDNKTRKFNTISKSEFFKKIEKDYEYWRNGIYKRKHGSKGIENAEYIQWDNLHNDVEAYGKNRWHLGSIDPKTLKLYKPAVVTRRVSKS